MNTRINHIHRSTIPVCPGCHRCMVRQDWDTDKPKATCRHCGKVHYYGQDGRIVMSATLRRREAA